MFCCEEHILCPLRAVIASEASAVVSMSRNIIRIYMTASHQKIPRCRIVSSFCCFRVQPGRTRKARRKTTKRRLSSQLLSASCCRLLCQDKKKEKERVSQHCPDSAWTQHCHRRKRTKRIPRTPRTIRSCAREAAKARASRFCLQHPLEFSTFSTHRS